MASTAERAGAIAAVYGLAVLPSLALLAWILFGLGDGYAGFAFSFECDDSGCNSGPIWQTMNWHPLLMTFAFGTLFTQAICAFKLLPFGHDRNKLVHMAIQATALVCSTAGIAVIITFKFKSGNYNFYTAHSWVGLLAFLLFIVQFLVGFVSFLFPKLPQNARLVIHPFHIFAGFCIYVLTMTAIFTGVADRELICGWAGCGMSSSVYSYNWMGANLVPLLLALAAAAAFWAHRPPTNRAHYAKEHGQPPINAEEETFGYGAADYSH